MSVKVAVRVRPFNSRELELNSSLCVDMKGNTTVLQDLEDPKRNRDFTFDYSFWSHDQFEINEDGLSVPIDSKYADQKQVFNTVGKEILNNAWEGYHCCLFAYGQTGAGKSYSMVGYGANKGIVPISCEEIFNRIAANRNPDINYEVQISMIEIYNEKVQDLLIHVNKRPAGGLKVREHKLYGVYVEGLTKYPVDSYVAIEKKMDEGNQHRTVASTLMNARFFNQTNINKINSSSRAHTIIQIEFKQIVVLNGKKTEKLSVINLVDLAGSEKVGKTGATGDRLKEAGQINKSLSVLGLVISTLADKSMGKGKNIVVPYRDSSLTRILQNALGGNSKTLMICAISPATDNYEETLSTLRYADQAKKIKCNAVINESETDKMIRELRTENDKLKNLLLSFQKQLQTGGKLDPKMLEQVSELQENLEANQHFMEENSKTYQEKLEEKQQQDEEEPEAQKEEFNVAPNQPHLMNLNEDPLLSGKLKYALTKEKTHIGRSNGQPLPEIIINGLGIQPNHAVISNENDLIFIQPVTVECGEFICLNGVPLKEKIQIHHLDRIIFGTTCAFLVKVPNEEDQQLIQGPEYDYIFVINEKNEKINQKRHEEQEMLEQEIKKEHEQKLQLLEVEKEKERKEAEEKMKKQQEEFEKKIIELQERMQNETHKQQMAIEKAEAEKQMIENMSKLQQEKEQKAQERERQKKLIEDEETMKKYRIKEKNFIENKLSKYLPKVLEVNLIAKELKRNVSLQAKLKYVYDTEQSYFNEDKAQRGQIQIQVTNREEGQVYLWDLHKFSNRYYIIKELLEKYFETGQIPTQLKQEDPFWDPPEARLIGQGFLRIQSLAYLMDNPTELTLVGENFQSGSLAVNLIPTDDTGQRNLSDDIEDGLEPAVEDPMELLGKRFDFRVVIQSARLPESHCKDTYVEYTIQVNEKDKLSYRTQTKYGQNPSPSYDYDQVHTYSNLSEELLNYIIQGTICFKVLGYEEQKQTKPQQQRMVPAEEEIEFQQQRKKNQQPTQQQQIIQEQQARIQIMSQTKPNGGITSQNQELRQENKQKENPVEERTQQPVTIQTQTKTQAPVQQFMPPTNINQPQLEKRPSQLQDRQGRSKGDEQFIPEQQQLNQKVQSKQTKQPPKRSNSSEQTPAMQVPKKKDDKCYIF